MPKITSLARLRGAKSTTAGTVKTVVATLAAASALFYLFGTGGRRRRGILRDKAVHARHLLRDGVQHRASDLAHRVKGRVHDVRARSAVVPDGVLKERARAALGHVCEHPHDVIIEARDGVLEVRGLREDERFAVLRRLHRVAGVRDVIDADRDDLDWLQPAHI